MDPDKKNELIYQAKKAVVTTSLLALGSTFELVSKYSSEMKAELADWKEGQTFALGVLPEGPMMTLRKEGGRLKYLGSGDRGSGLVIYIKTMDFAFMMMIGQWGPVKAFAEHRAIVHGGIWEAMQTNRAMALAQKFLLPGFILNKNVRRPPVFTKEDWATKAKVMALLGPTLALNLFK